MISMIVFFDTNVHIALLRGQLSLEELTTKVPGTVRLSPIVASELLRGAKGKAKRSVERLLAQLVPLEPPSWRTAWLRAGRLLPEVFPSYECIGLGRLQNDCLLAITAASTGALLVTMDNHFQSLKKHLHFNHYHFTLLH
jgi:predicted nucleic acid-binding protein